MKASIAALVVGGQKVNNYMSSNEKSKTYRIKCQKHPFFRRAKKKAAKNKPRWIGQLHHTTFFLAVITKTIVFYIRSPLPKLTRRAAVRFRISCSGQICHLPTSPPIGLETQETWHLPYRKRVGCTLFRRLFIILWSGELSKIYGTWYSEQNSNIDWCSQKRCLQRFLIFLIFLSNILFNSDLPWASLGYNIFAFHRFFCGIVAFLSHFSFQLMSCISNIMYFKQRVELQRSSQTSSLGHLCHFVEVRSLGLDLNKHSYHNSYHIHIFISQFIFMSLCWGTLSTAGSPIMSTCHSIMPSKWTSTSLPAVKRF